MDFCGFWFSHRSCLFYLQHCKAWGTSPTRNQAWCPWSLSLWTSLDSLGSPLVFVFDLKKWLEAPWEQILIVVESVLGGLGFWWAWSIFSWARIWSSRWGFPGLCLCWTLQGSPSLAGASCPVPPAAPRPPPHPGVDGAHVLEIGADFLPTFYLWRCLSVVSGLHSFPLFTAAVYCSLLAPLFLLFRRAQNAPWFWYL